MVKDGQVQTDTAAGGGIRFQTVRGQVRDRHAESSVNLLIELLIKIKIQLGENFLSNSVATIYFFYFWSNSVVPILFFTIPS